jgi:hypothetical protein
MPRCKNIGGSPPRGDGGDGDDSTLRITEVAREKRKLISRKKRTREEREAEEALAVARAADRAESGGRGSGILIGESRTRVPLSRRILGTEATEDQPKEPAEQVQQSPPRHHSGRSTRSQTTPVAPSERPRHRGRPAPRSQVIHYDLRRASARQIQTFRKV